MRRWVHARGHYLTHLHEVWTKPDVGDFALCGPRFFLPFGRLSVAYQPPGASYWRPVPASIDVEVLFAAPDPHAVAALITAAGRASDDSGGGAAG